MSDKAFDSVIAASAAVASFGQVLSYAEQKEREKRIFEGLGDCTTLTDGMAVLNCLHLVAMVAAFSGAPFAQVVKTYAGSGKVAALAGEIEGVCLLTVNVMIDNLRHLVLVTSFGADPASRFAAELEIVCATSEAASRQPAASSARH